MPALTILNQDALWFPGPEMADGEGLLAMGGDLRAERLMAAYRKGIFPWYDGEVPLWWNPDPRFVLFPDRLRISKSMRVLLKKGHFGFSTNTSFEAVITACQLASRPGQDGTWINQDVIDAYTNLHQLGVAHSFEAWQDGKLAGGLYGLKIGRVFFGESMFSHQSNASKAAFIWAVEGLKAEGIALIDCQVYTSHLESLGAEMIPRQNFLEMLQALIGP